MADASSSSTRSAEVAHARHRQLDGGPICCCRSRSGCWLTWMNPSRGRSRSTTIMMTAPRAIDEHDGAEQAASSRQAGAVADHAEAQRGTHDEQEEDRLRDARVDARRDPALVEIDRLVDASRRRARRRRSRPSRPRPRSPSRAWRGSRSTDRCRPGGRSHRSRRSAAARTGGAAPWPGSRLVPAGSRRGGTPSRSRSPRPGRARAGRRTGPPPCPSSPRAGTPAAPGSSPRACPSAPPARRASAPATSDRGGTQPRSRSS